MPPAAPWTSSRSRMPRRCCGSRSPGDGRVLLVREPDVWSDFKARAMADGGTGRRLRGRFHARRRSAAQATGPSWSVVRSSPRTVPAGEHPARTTLRRCCSDHRRIVFAARSEGPRPVASSTCSWPSRNASTLRRTGVVVAGWSEPDDAASTLRCVGRPAGHRSWNRPTSLVRPPVFATAWAWLRAAGLPARAGRVAGRCSCAANVPRRRRPRGGVVAQRAPISSGPRRASPVLIRCASLSPFPVAATGRAAGQRALRPGAMRLRRKFVRRSGGRRCQRSIRSRSCRSLSRASASSRWRRVGFLFFTGRLQHVDDGQVARPLGRTLADQDVSQGCDQNGRAPDLHRGRPVAKPRIRSDAMDCGHEVHLKPVVIPHDAVQVGHRVVRPKNDRGQPAGHLFHLHEVPRRVRKKKSKSTVVTGAPCSAAAAFPMRTALR